MKHVEKAIKTKGSTIILRGALAAIGLAVLAICIFALPPAWVAVPDEFPARYTYVAYGLIAALYAAAIPFFVALLQAFRLLNYIDKDKVYSKRSVNALRNIAYCGVAISVVFAAAFPLFFTWGEQEDAPGLIVIGMFMVVAPLIVSVFSGVLQRLLHEAIMIKSENDLTV